MTDENQVETTTETTTVEQGPEGTRVEETTEQRTEPSEGYKDESPAQPVQTGPDTVTPENPSTPAHEVVEEVHERQAENSGADTDGD